MYDVIKVLLFFSVLLGICAVAEWLADNAPWIIWILIPFTLWIMYVATFGNHFNDGKEENK